MLKHLAKTGTDDLADKMVVLSFDYTLNSNSSRLRLRVFVVISNLQLIISYTQCLSAALVKLYVIFIRQDLTAANTVTTIQEI